MNRVSLKHFSKKSTSMRKTLSPVTTAGFQRTSTNNTFMYREIHAMSELACVSCWRTERSIPYHIGILQIQIVQSRLFVGTAFTTCCSVVSSFLLPSGIPPTSGACNIHLDIFLAQLSKSVV